MANEKIISQSVFEEAIKDILTELVNSTYQWESYSDEEVGQLVELDPTQVAELSAVINDSVSAKNKVYSSQYTKELLQENLIEANKYSDDLVANLSNIKLDIVDSLPDSSTVNKSTIYILKDSTGGTNNTLNVWSDSTSAFVEVGKLSVDFTNYYTKSEVDAELAKKANADEVLKPDAIVADLTTTSGSTVLSTAGLQTELDKKIDKSGILSSVSDIPSDENVLSEKAVKTELDKLFQSVSDGKTLVASAITDKGVDTLATDTFSTMADNIGKIQSGVDLTNIYSAIRTHGLTVSGNESEEEIAKIIEGLFTLKTITETSEDIVSFTDLADDTIHDTEVTESASGIVISSDSELQGTVSDDYIEFEEVDKSNYESDVKFM